MKKLIILLFIAFSTFTFGQSKVWSDSTLKHTVIPFNGGLEIVKNLTALEYFFNFKNKERLALLDSLALTKWTQIERDSFTLLLNGVNMYNSKQYGFFAQAMQRVFPGAVTGSTILGINYNALMPVLVNATKELDKKVDRRKLIKGVSIATVLNPLVDKTLIVNNSVLRTYTLPNPNTCKGEDFTIIKGSNSTADIRVTCPSSAIYAPPLLSTNKNTPVITVTLGDFTSNFYKCTFTSDGNLWILTSN